MSRKSTTMGEDAFDRLDGHKHDDESWTEFGHRVADVLDAHDGDGEHASNTPAVPDDVLTEGHIDDIGAEVERRVERTLENLSRP